jgi:hypothetical protein
VIKHKEGKRNEPGVVTGRIRIPLVQNPSVLQIRMTLTWFPIVPLSQGEEMGPWSHEVRPEADINGSGFSCSRQR